MTNNTFVELSEMFIRDDEFESLEDYLLRISKLYSRCPHKCNKNSSFGYVNTPGYINTFNNQQIICLEDRKRVFESIDEICNKLDHLKIREQIPGADIHSIMVNLRYKESLIWEAKGDNGLCDYIRKTANVLYQSGKICQIVFLFDSPIHKDIYGDDCLFYTPFNKSKVIPLSKI